MGACHARHVAGAAGATLAWVADPVETIGQALATELGSTWLADGNTDAALNQCDAVIVASPDRFHAASLHAALDRGLPVLAEKPLTEDLEDAAELVNREAALGRRLIQLGFMRVYDERHRQVQAALAPLGEVNHIRAVHRNAWNGGRTVAQILVQSIVHDLHTIRWLSRAEIVEVATATVERDGLVHMVVVTCGLSNGGVATIDFDDAAAGYEVSVEVSAVGGNVVAADPLRALVRANGNIGSVIGSDWFAPFLDTYRVELEDWLASITAGEARGPSVWDGYAGQAVVAAAAQSAELGRPQTVTMMDRPTLYADPVPHPGPAQT